MITTAKIKAYERNRGSYDGFYMQSVRRRKNILSDSEWNLIDRLCQEVSLVDKGLASEEFSKKLEEKLRETCDSEETISYLKNVPKKGWF